MVRIWHGRVATDRAEEYLRLMRDVAVPDYRETPGNLAAYALSRTEDAVTHVLMLSHWESLAAVALSPESQSSRRSTTTSTATSCWSSSRPCSITRCPAAPAAAPPTSTSDTPIPFRPAQLADMLD